MKYELHEIMVRTEPGSVQDKALRRLHIMNTECCESPYFWQMDQFGLRLLCSKCNREAALTAEMVDATDATFLP